MNNNAINMLTNKERKELKTKAVTQTNKEAARSADNEIGLAIKTCLKG